MSAQQVLDTVLDAGSFASWAPEWQLETPCPLTDAGYARELAEARRVSGADEAVVVGEGRLAGRRVAVVVSEFGFLAGSVGAVAANRIVGAVRRATDEALPLLAAPASGGTRMQEGTPAFLAMREIAAAFARHRRAALPSLVWLRHPTFGGVLASWGSLGQFTAAEPGAAIGFLGPRVHAALRGEAFPAGVQTAENLWAHGLVDALLPLPDLRAAARRVLELVCVDEAGPISDRPQPAVVRPAADAWPSVLCTRRPDRPGVRDVLRRSATVFVELHGTGRGEPGPGIVLAVARFGSRSCVLVGQDRAAQRAGRQIGPGSLRVARRGMRLAQELQLPLVSVVDTPGAELSRDAEQGGLAAEIASCLADLSALSVPTVTVLLGEGTGGAAIALCGARRTIAARHAWLAPLPPEGASSLLFRTTAKAPETAALHRMDSASLLAAGFVQRIVDECPDAADEPDAFAHRLVRAIEAELTDAAGCPDLTPSRPSCRGAR